jgi:hypothetical protein
MYLKQAVMMMSIKEFNRNLVEVVKGDRSIVIGDFSAHIGNDRAGYTYSK